MLRGTEVSVIRSVRRSVVIVGLLGGTLAFAACGSSNDADGESSAAKSSTVTTTSASGAGETITLPTGTVKLHQTYAPGVPTLDALYKGTEQPPPSDGPKAAKDKTVIIVSCGQVVPACAGVAKAMTAAFTTLGWKSRIIDGALNANNGWSTGLRQAIAAHPDAIVN